MAAESEGRQAPGMVTRISLPLLILLAFGTFSAELVRADGYTGFLTVAAREKWALQMLLDVGIACTVAGFLWLVPDAKKRGIPAWPYLVATLFLGSVGLLAYLVHREVKAAWSSARVVRGAGVGN